MGKDNLMLGTARGKLGDVVFYRTGGEQRFRTRVKPMNPNTDAQIIQRIVTATAVRSYSEVITVCDHAFQGFEGKMKNQQRYMKLNIKLLRDKILNNIMSWSPLVLNNLGVGNWNKKGATRPVVNDYIISEGDLPSVPFNFFRSTVAGGNQLLPAIEIPIFDGDVNYVNLTTMTYQDVCNALGLNAGDQLTFVEQTVDGTTPFIDRTYISRIVLMPSNGNMQEKFITKAQGDEVTINMPNAENYGNLKFFNVVKESEPAKLVILPETNETITKQMASFGVIVSRYENRTWRRSNTQMILTLKNFPEGELMSAMESYKKSVTSSLYLNQSNYGAYSEAEGFSEIANDEEIVIENAEEQQERGRRGKK